MYFDLCASHPMAARNSLNRGIINDIIHEISAETSYQELLPNDDFNNHYKEISADISWIMSLIMPRFNDFRAAIGWDAHRSKYITGDYLLQIKDCLEEQCSL